MNDYIQPYFETTPHKIYLQGVKYYLGKEVDQNYEKAFELFKIAANKAHVKAMVFLGICYKEGYGTPKNDINAFQIWKRAASFGNSYAELYLGDCYKNGIGTSKNDKFSIGCYNRATAKLEKKTQTEKKLFNEGLHAFIKENYKLAFNSFRSAVKRKFVPAYWYLGRCYLEGKGVIMDVNKSISVFKNGAKRGDKQSCYTLGVLYRNGIEVKPIPTLSFYYFNMGANLGHTDSMLESGLALFKGWGCIENRKFAQNYLSQFENSNFDTEDIKRMCLTKMTTYWEDCVYKPDSLNCIPLGMCYMYGHGVKKSPEKADFCFRIALKNKDRLEPDILTSIGHFWIKGKRLPIDEKEGENCLLDAIKKNSLSALFRLAKYYKEKKRFAERFKLLKEGIKTNDPVIIYKYAKCYEKGLGTIKNKLFYIHYCDLSQRNMQNSQNLNLSFCYFKTMDEALEEIKRAGEHFDHPIYNDTGYAAKIIFNLIRH